MPFNLRVDAYHSQDTIGEIQHLIGLAANNKEEFDYTLLYLKKKLAMITVDLKKKRENLLRLLEKLDIDWVQYPVFSDVFSDDVYQDTVAPDTIGLVDIEKAMRKNIPNEMFNLMKEKLSNYASISDRLNRSIDDIKKAKLNKAFYEHKYIKILEAKKEYQENEDKYRDTYLAVRKDLEDAMNLHGKLGDFMNMFTSVPQALTSSHSARLNDNQKDMLCSMYVGKKKAIKAQADSIRQNYDDVSRYSGWGTAVQPENVVAYMQNISLYFGSTGDALPAQYVDASQNKMAVIDRISALMEQVATYISNIKKVLDQIRGTTGIGNKEIESLYSNVIEIARSPVNVLKIEQTNLNDITDVNKNRYNDTKTNVDAIKNFLKRGVDSINTRMTKFQKDQAVKIYINMGYLVTNVKDRNQSLEDNVRERVRKKFGHIPFCDEVEISNPMGGTMFVKKKDVEIKTDPVTGKKTVRLLTEIQGNALLKKALES